jgi:hypothetical protein
MSLDELVEARFKRFRAYGAMTILDQPTEPAARTGFGDRLRNMLTAKPSRPSFPGARDDVAPGREEV